MRNNVYSDIFWYKDMLLPVSGRKKNENFQNFMYNIYDKLWGDDITNSLILNIHKDWSRNVFQKKCEISKCHNFLISYSIFIIFAPICRGNFLLFLLKLW